MASPLKRKIYHAARKRGDTPKKARKIANDLDRKIIEAHDTLVELERVDLLGKLRTEIATAKATTIRFQTGLTFTTINRFKSDRLEDYHPHQRTIQSIALFCDMEVTVKKKGRTATIHPIRR